jgi:hypothetical protein
MNIPNFEGRTDDFIWSNTGNEDTDRRNDEKFQLAQKPHLAVAKKPRRRGGIHRRRRKRMN